MEESNRFDFSIIVETAKRIITSPTQFYQNMPHSGGYGNPVVFVVVLALAAGVISSIWALLGAGPAAGMASGVATIVILPLFTVIGSFILGVLLFVIWKLMGSTQGYETAYRCVAFSIAILPVVAIANLIPYLGQIIQTGWACWLMYIASIHVHKISLGTAKVVFAVLAGLLLISSISTEYQARKLQNFAEEYSEKLAAANPLNGDMDATELGKAATGFLTGLHEGSNGTALTPQQTAELEQAGAAMGKIVESMQETAREFENKNPEDITPQDAGAAMGALFSALQDAAKSMPGQNGNAGIAAAQAPPLSSIDTEQLSSLGVIAKPSRSHAIQFSVNDSARFAPVSEPVKVYQDSDGIRYQLFLENAYLMEFISLGDAAISAPDGTAAPANNDSADVPSDQNIAVNNAAIFVYDDDGVVIAGDECGPSVLQIGVRDNDSSPSAKRELWLWCPQSLRKRLTR